MEALLRTLHVAPARFTARRDDPTFHPGRCADIVIDGDAVGVVGEVHPQVQENYGIDERVYLATLDTQKLFDHRLPDATYSPLPRFPALTRDVALVCGEELEVAGIEDVFRETFGELLESLTLFDVYRGKSLGDNVKSVAYALVLRDREATLTDARAAELLDQALDTLKNKYGVTLRS